MYDIHCHLIEGIDDGPSNFEESIKICRAAVKDRVKSIVATPHYMDGVYMITPPKLLSELQLLNTELKSRGIDLTVFPGMEIYMSPDIVSLYNRGEIITLNHSRYMLIELSVYSIPSYMEHILFELQLKGIKPIIAHPERYRSIIRKPNIVCDLIDKGCLIQINASSLEGLLGKDARKTAYTLLEHNMVHIVATDNHSICGRMSSFRGCYRMISKKFGKNLADDLFINNPLRIINDQEVFVKEPLKVKKWFSIFK